MRSRARRSVPRIFLLVALVAAAVVAGIAVALSRTAPPSRARVVPVVLRWANEGTSDLASLDPAIFPDLNTHQAAQLIFGGLVRFGPGFRVLPDAAARWTVGRDGRVYTFYLRPNVRFGDGTRLTASDVAFSLNRALSPHFANNSGAYLLSDIAGAASVVSGRVRQPWGIQVLGPRVLRIRLVHATASFLAKLATPAGYSVPTARVRADPRGWAQQAEGTGPFMVARWVHNNDLLLVPNRYYWSGRPRITGIDMPFIPEPLTAFKRYRTGAVDVMGTVRFPTEEFEAVQGDADFHRSARLETVFLTLNERVRPLGSALVREALARALDTAAIARDVYDTFAQPAAGMLPPGLPGYSPSLPGTGFNPGTARRLLARAGFPAGRGLPPITYMADQDAQSLALATAITGQWERVLGVHVRLQVESHTAYNNRLATRDFGIAVIDWTADYPDPQNFLSQQLRTGSPNNNGGWSNRTFDRLVDAADGLPLRAPRRFALYHRAEMIAIRQAATIPLVNPTTGILLRSNVHGLQVSGGQILARNWARVTVGAGSN